MRIWLIRVWDRVNTSYWFVPSMMAVAAVVLAFVTVALDNAFPSALVEEMDWVYRGGPEGAAGVLTAIAGSMITIAGLVFSLTLVTLSLASSQFGPRLLRNFIRDRVTQLVLGTFLAAFLYCLFVLRTIRREENGVEFVPHMSVTIGVLFALAGMVMLIYFVHHLATSIQADTLIARVADELAGVTENLYPEKIGEGDPAPPDPVPPGGEATVVAADGNGYIEAVDPDAVVAAAEKHDVVIELVRRPGHYVLEGTPVARVWPGDRRTDGLADAVNAAVVRGSVRTPTQDVEFVVNQLVEIAVRALSPGINDPFTAITCVDRLGSGLAGLARRNVPSAYRRGGDGKVRVIARPVEFPEVLDAAFNQIRQYGRTSAAVSIRMLEVLTDLAAVVTRPADRAALRRHAEMIARAARDALPEENDRRDVEDRFRAAVRALAGEASTD